MINRLSNPINHNRSAAKISKVMSSSADNVPTVRNIASYRDLLVKEPLHSVEEANADFWLANGRQGIAGQVRI